MFSKPPANSRKCSTNTPSNRRNSSKRSELSSHLESDSLSSAQFKYHGFRLQLLVNNANQATEIAEQVKEETMTLVQRK